MKRITVATLMIFVVMLLTACTEAGNEKELPAEVNVVEIQEESTVDNGDENKQESNESAAIESGASEEESSEVLDENTSANPEPKQEEVVIGPEEYAIDAIHVAANRGEIDKVREILLTSPDVDARDSFGGTALHAAMFQSNMEIVEELIAYGYDVNAQGTSNLYTPLHDAIWASNLDAVKILIENGADLTIENNRGLTPIEKAYQDEKTEIYELLQSYSENQ